MNKDDAEPEPEPAPWTEEDSARVEDLLDEAAPGPWVARPMAEARPGKGHPPDAWGVFLPDGSVPCGRADAELKAAGRNDLPRAAEAVAALERWGAGRAATIIRAHDAARGLLDYLDACARKREQPDRDVVRRRAGAILAAVQADDALADLLAEPAPGDGA